MKVVYIGRYRKKIVAGLAILMFWGLMLAMEAGFKNFKAKDQSFSFNHPASFLFNEQDFSGGDIRYHVDFHDQSGTARGFVQVWNLTGTLEEFLANARQTSSLNYTSFASKPIHVNCSSGYLWDYTFSGRDGTGYKGLEVFLEKKGLMYRISYFVPENLWSNKHSITFQLMVDSFKIAE